MEKIRSDYIYSFSKTPVPFRTFTLENLTTSRAIPTSTYIYRNISSSSGIEDEIDLSSDITNRGNGKMHNQRTPKLKKSSQKKILLWNFLHAHIQYYSLLKAVSFCFLFPSKNDKIPEIMGICFKSVSNDRVLPKKGGWGKLVLSCENTQQKFPFGCPLSSCCSILLHAVLPAL